MLGSLNDLINAAKGKMPSKQPPPTPVPLPKNLGYVDALQRRSTLGMEYGDLATAANTYGIDPNTNKYTGKYGNAYVDAATSSPTSTFAKILAGTGRTSTGTGKYGGFSNAGDLQTAIGGAAINLRGTTVPQLRAQAESRYGALDRMYGPALGQAVPFTTDYNPGRASAAQFRIAEELASNPKYKEARKGLNEYMTTLNDWYAQQAAPAEEYLRTAQQIERTPLSQLASTIAVQGYGMDPNLAAGKFSDLDNQFYTRQRDAEYLQQYGMPYEQYRTQLAEQTATNKRTEQATEKALAGTIEQTTGLSSKRLAETTGKTPAQIYGLLNKQFNVDGQIYNGGGAVSELMKFIDAGDMDAAGELIKSFEATAGGYDIGLLLKAISKYYISNPYKMDVDLTEAGL